MKRTGLAPLAFAILAGWASLTPAHAVPPTATPSPGYDARLREQQAATRMYTPLAPVRKPPRRTKRHPAN